MNSSLSSLKFLMNRFHGCYDRNNTQAPLKFKTWTAFQHVTLNMERSISTQALKRCTAPYDFEPTSIPTWQQFGIRPFAMLRPSLPAVQYPQIEVPHGIELPIKGSLPPSSSWNQPATAFIYTPLISHPFHCPQRARPVDRPENLENLPRAGDKDPNIDSDCHCRDKNVRCRTVTF